MMRAAWKFLDRSWRDCGAKQLQPPRIRAVFYALLQVPLYWLFKAIDNYHFDGNHPERWQR